MFIYVLFVLMLTAIIIIASTTKRFQGLLRKISIKKCRHLFLGFGFIFVVASMVLSKVLDDPLRFPKVSTDYSTGVWAMLFVIVLYIFAFQEFHLNTVIISEEKEWKRISNDQLLKLYHSKNIQIINAKNANTLKKEDVFLSVVAFINFECNNSVDLNNISTGLESEKQFMTYYYSSKDERLTGYLDSISELLNMY